MARSRFPFSKVGRQTLEFFPAPQRAPLRAFAALLFPWKGGETLLCHICDRGWCIPSGRVEPNESSLEAAIREAKEESGAVLQDVLYLGCYRISERGEVRWADVYTGCVIDLVEISHTEESLGRKFVTRGELPEAYYMWNELMSEIFDYSYEVLVRHQKYLSGE